MSETDPNGVIRYTTKEILADINEKLSKNNLLVEQMDRRLTSLELRVGVHDQMLSEQMPKLEKFMREMDVRREVDAALEARNVRGASLRTKMLVAIPGVVLAVVSILALLPRAAG